jgi:hypothetical protein
VGFDEQASEEFAAPPIPALYAQSYSLEPLPTERYELDSGWSLVSSLGVEASYPLGPLGFSAALAGLLPLRAAKSDWGDTSSLSHVGAEVSVGLWFSLGQRSAVAVTDPSVTQTPDESSQ